MDDSDSDLIHWYWTTGSHLPLKEDKIFSVLPLYLFNPEPTSNILETDIPFTRKIVDGMGIGDGIGHGESINKH